MSTVYFLGAGASAAVSQEVVITRNLLEVALSLRPKELKGKRERAARRQVAALVHSIAGEGPCPGVDEVLSIVDLALGRDLPLGAGWGLERLAGVRQDLLVLIYTCIESRIHKPAEISDALVRLVRKIDEESHAAGSPPIVITLNWDCLLEKALFRWKGNPRENQISYGIPCYLHDGAQPLQPAQTAMTILKPHGSLNWGFCPVCRRLSVSHRDPIDFSKPRRCAICLMPSPLEPVIVPPTFSVEPRPLQLARIWEQVEDAVAGCDRLVFIGYSLPAQDVNVRLHLLRARGRRGTRALRVEVVTRTKPCAREADVEKKRYESLLGSDVRYRAYAEGLAGWVADTGGPKGASHVA